MTEMYTQSLIRKARAICDQPRYLGGSDVRKLLLDMANQLEKKQQKLRLPWEARFFFPIVMPLDEHGRGPASEEDGSIRKLTWEVWDQFCTSYSTHSTLGAAVIEAERMNDTFGSCVDEGCEHYGTPHTH